MSIDQRIHEEAVPTLPPLGPTIEMAVPSIVERNLSNGLRVLAVHRSGAPLVEFRLRIPADVEGHGDAAVNLLLVQTMLAGTAGLDRMELAERIEDLGASLMVEVDADSFMVGGLVLATHAEPLLGLLAEVLRHANYPDAEVAAERERLLQRLRMARSKASVRARETLQLHLFGEHPYGQYLPDPEIVAAATAAQLRRVHAKRIVATGATLVLVGDIEPVCLLDQAAEALTGWSGEVLALAPMPALPGLLPDVSLLVHRAGSVQSSIRIGGPAVRRDDPRYPALQLANLLYGGYFSSRLVRNIREEKGYTYSPRSRIEHGIAGSTLVVEADVATEVTAPALLEMWYELGRLSTLRPTDEDLTDARQYAVGTLAMTVATHGGLASTLIALDCVGLDLTWICEHPRLLAEVTAEDIYQVGIHILAPVQLAVVVIGDATHTAEPLKAFGPWEVRW